MSFIGDLLGGVGSVVSLIPGIGSLTSAGIGALGSALGSSMNQSESLKNQRDFMAYNFDRQSEENQKNRDFQREEWTRQFDLVNQYNTPVAQAARLRAAGINPAVAFGSSGTQTSAGSSSAGVSTPSPAGSLSPSPDYSAVLTRGFQSQESLFKRLQILTDVQKGTIQNSYLGQQLSADVQKTMADIKSVELRNQIEQFGFDLDKLFAVSRRSKELDKLTNEAQLAYANTLLALDKRGEVSASAFEKAMAALQHYAAAHLSNVQSREIDTLLESRLAEIKSRVNANNAAAQQSRAAAGLASEQSEDIRQMRDLRIDILTIERDLKRQDFGFGSATFNQRVSAVNESLIHSKLFTDEQKETLKHMGVINSYQEFDKWFGYVTRLMDLALPNPSSANPSYGFPELDVPPTVKP